MGRGTLEVGQIRLLVELGRAEAEGVDDVVDRLSAVVEVVSGLLGRGVGADVCALLARLPR